HLTRAIGYPDQTYSAGPMIAAAHAASLHAADDDEEKSHDAFADTAVHGNSRGGPRWMRNDPRIKEPGARRRIKEPTRPRVDADLERQVQVCELSGQCPSRDHQRGQVATCNGRYPAKPRLGRA